jgi:hypothetical protein
MPNNYGNGDCAFESISTETERVYTFPSGAEVYVPYPVALHVGDDGEHVIVDRGYWITVIEPGWIAVRAADFTLRFARQH